MKILNMMVSSPPAQLYQIHMEYTVCGHREVDLCLSNDVRDVVQQHAEIGLDFKSMTILSRNKKKMKKGAEVYNLTTLAPEIYKIEVRENTLLDSVAVFGLRAQFLSILHNNQLMQPKHFAPDYDIFAGKLTSPITHYREVNTGDSFETDCAKYCGHDPYNMPFPMILFYDKTYVDIHGSLACSPIIMWPTFFNQQCRNMLKFTGVLGHVPNLSLGKSKSTRQKAKDKLQEEHDCLRPIFNQIKEVYEKGGIKTKVMGRDVKVVIWIHIIRGVLDFPRHGTESSPGKGN